MTINSAVYVIGDIDNPIDPATIRAAAKRLGVIVVNDDGRQSIPVTVVDDMRKTWRATGYLGRRRRTASI
jgi:hypothetical protein